MPERLTTSVAPGFVRAIAVEMSDAVGDELLELPIIIAQDRHRHVLDLDNHRLGPRALAMPLPTIVCHCALSFADVLRAFLQRHQGALESAPEVVTHLSLCIDAIVIRLE